MQRVNHITSNSERTRRRSANRFPADELAQSRRGGDGLCNIYNMATLATDIDCILLYPCCPNIHVYHIFVCGNSNTQANPLDPPVAAYAE